MGLYQEGEESMRANSVVILVVAIVLGGIAAFLARSWLLSRTQVTATSETIVAAAKHMTFGTPLSDDNVKEIPWAAKTLPPGSFSSKQALFKDGRRVTLGIIEPNEPILSSKITGPGQRASLSTVLASDKRAITIRVDDVRGVAGFILPNDRVDVVLIRSESSSQGRKDFSDLLLQDVKVIAVDQITSEQKDRPVVAKAVTLEVTPYQAQKISLATNIGHLSLILRKAGASDVVANRRVTETDLIEGEAAARRVVAPQGRAPAANRPPPVPVKSRFDTTVSIVRNLKTEDYKVIKER
jgi:pilus assembly protein CpaB